MTYHLSDAGVGGVHRGGEKSMDISADLIELGRTPMAGMSARLDEAWLHFV